MRHAELWTPEMLEMARQEEERRKRYQHLSRLYRYSHYYGGVTGTGLIILPVGLRDDPLKQNLFNTEIQLVTISLFGEGYAANPVYTSYAPVVFQSGNTVLDLERAKRVTAKWRELKRQDVNILHEYRDYSPARRVLREMFNT